MPNALITGVSAGIGRATALALGRQGFHVVGAGRSEERTMPVVDQVTSSGGSAEYLHLDLGSLSSVDESARAWLDSGRPLDLVVNNAGVGGERGVTDDGFEVHFGVNHLGHFLLTLLLMPSLGNGSRVVQVTSAAHLNVDGIDFELLEGRTRTLTGWREYAVSKLANVLFASELARRTEVQTYSVHPGMTSTQIFPRILRLVLGGRLQTPEQGADTVIWCATSDDVAGHSGLYYRSREPRPPSRAAQDQELARELWERSEQWCGLAPLD